jgi:ABC-type phosphate transport system substrate-binding protein
MKRTLWKKAIVCLAAGAAAGTLAGTAAAGNPDCSTLPGSTYITGSSAVKPLVAGLAKALAGTTTLIYKGQGSCTGVDAILNGTKITGTASYWDNTGTENTCNLSLAGDVADVGVSDVFATTCPMVTSLPADVGDFFGPNQVMSFVVPTASSQTMISAEAAYFVYGFGMAGMAAPWTDETFIFQRSATSGTQAMIATAINVPPNKWKGVMESSSGNMLSALVAAATTGPEKAIGILASDVADANRDKVKILAYQHFKQDCAWLPDSSATSFDKLNVRDGHYPIWGPLHLLAKVDTNKVPVKPDAANLIGYFTGKVATPAGVNLLDLEIAAHTVPACAMKVQRTAELGPVSAYTPAQPCGCYFEAKANASTTCAACAKDSDCTGSATHCRYGYCEAS